MQHTRLALIVSTKLRALKSTASSGCFDIVVSRREGRDMIAEKRWIMPFSHETDRVFESGAQTLERFQHVQSHTEMIARRKRNIKNKSFIESGAY